MSTRPVVPITPAPEPAAVPRRPPAAEIVSWVMLALLILFILIQHLVTTTIVGLTLFVILDRVSERFQGRMKRGVVRPLALLVVTTMTAAIIAIAIAVTATMLRRGASTIPDMMNQMAEILGSVRLWLGGLGRQFIPEMMTDAEDLKATIALWLKTHAQTLRAGL